MVDSAGWFAVCRLVRCPSSASTAIGFRNYVSVSRHRRHDARTAAAGNRFFAGLSEIRIPTAHSSVQIHQFLEPRWCHATAPLPVIENIQSALALTRWHGSCVEDDARYPRGVRQLRKGADWTFEIIDGMPDGTVGLMAKGAVTPTDCEQTLLPLVANHSLSHRHSPMLLLFGRNFEGLRPMRLEIARSSRPSVGLRSGGLPSPTWSGRERRAGFSRRSYAVTCKYSTTPRSGRPRPGSPRTLHHDSMESHLSFRAQAHVRVDLIVNRRDSSRRRKDYEHPASIRTQQGAA
jgi:hypothetical protein